MDGSKRRGRIDAAAVHDGQSWRLVVPGCAEIATFASPAGKLPQELVDAALAASVRRLLFLVSGELHVIDGAIPKGAGMAKVSEQIRLAIAEATGVDSDDALVTGMTLSWPGVRKPFTLASSFEFSAAEDFHAALEEAGIACAGFASLELSLLAAWRRKASGRQSFVAVASGHALVVPAPRGTNPGPQTAACGLRHFATDAANWLTRFRRSAAAVERKNPLHLLVFGDDNIADALSGAGYSEVVEESPSEWLFAAMREAYASKPNRCRGVAVPVANPWERHRRFSTGWLVAAALFVLAVPAAFRFACEWSCGRRCGAIAMEASKLKPGAEKTRAAQKALAAARSALSREIASGRARVEMRRPLVAFVEVAHFFCKNAGGTTVLTSFVQKGNRISVTGRFLDSEDGMRLYKSAVAFAEEKGIQIVENAVEREDAGEGLSLNIFKLSFDCSKIGEAD